MSSTNRGFKRIDQDRYYTPSTAITPLLSLINWSKVYTFLEPCVGRGDITNAVSTHCNQLHITKPLMHIYDLDTGIDYIALPSPKVKYDLCITNPPFSFATQFIEKTVSECNHVFMLLRINFLGSQTRKPFWGRYPVNSLFVLSQRPSFISTCKVCKTYYNAGVYKHCPNCIEKGLQINLARETDSTEYAWFYWGDGSILNSHSPITIL